MPEALDQSETSGISVHKRHIALTLSPPWSPHLPLSMLRVVLFRPCWNFAMNCLLCAGKLWAGLQHRRRYWQSPYSRWSRDFHHQDYPWRGSCHGWEAGVSPKHFLLLLFMALLTVFLWTGWMTVCCVWMMWTCPRWFTAGQWRPSRRRGQLCGCWSGGGRPHPRPFWRLTC